MKVNFSSMISRTRTAITVMIAFLVLAAGPAAPVRAGITLGIESVNASVGVFDVFLTNTGPSAVHIDTTQFEIISSSAQVSLTSATISTTDYSYIFAGNSLFGPTISTLTGQTLDASDLYGASGDVSIAANSSVGLGHIFFTVTGTLSSPVTISFNPNVNFTSLADQGNNVAINTFQSGTISVSGSVVPEPCSLIGLLSALPIVAVAFRHASTASIRRQITS